MNPGEISLIIAGSMIGYIIVGYTVYYQFNKHGNSFDEDPLYVMYGTIWPLTIVILLGVISPVVVIAWTHKKIQRRLKTKVVVQEVK